MKFRIIANIVTTGYIGDVEVEDGLDMPTAYKEAYKKADVVMKTLRDQRISKYNLDNDEFYIDDIDQLEKVEPGEDGMYIPMKVGR